MATPIRFRRFSSSGQSKDVRTIAGVAGIIYFGLAAASFGQVPASNTNTRHKLQTTDRAVAATLADAGGRLVADYGAFLLYDTPAVVTNFPADKVETRDDYNSIFLNAVRLDTSQPATRALRRTAGQFAGKRLHLVQFSGPLLPEWRSLLLDTGAQIVSYIPQNTFLIYGDSKCLGEVQARAAAAPHVQWEGPYLDEYKVHPAALHLPAAIDQFAIQLVADNQANPGTLQLIDEIKLAPLARRNSVLQYLNIVARIAPANLARLAARPDVISIQPYGTPRKVSERQDQIAAGKVSGDSLSGSGYLNWLESKGFAQRQFDASGFVVDMADSGIDNGTTSPNHFGLYPEGRISAPSRVVYNRLEGTPHPGSTLAGCDGHGNLNAHIVCGYDNGNGFPFADSSGYHYGLGTCPFALVGSSVIFDPDEFTNPSFSELMSAAYFDGARISNNSWAGADDGLYDIDAQEYDALVRDAQPDGSEYAALGNQEMVIVFAAGNDTNAISPPGTAKNVITVGAAENVQAFGGADGCGTTDADAANANAIIYFSGAGPTADGRSKPDLVAPGTHVTGGAPQAPDPGPTGAAAPCFLGDASGVCGGVGTNFFFPVNQQFYTASSGTSHSTPCVSAGCALLRQYFINRGEAPPSPAMTKAYLMNSARYLTGPRADDSLWSNTQGMGEMDLGMAFDGVPRDLIDESTNDIFTASGQSRAFSGTVADAAKPFRVTVVWTDAPGSTTGAAYNNIIDLTVTIGGGVYKGNVFEGAFSTTGGQADTRNNVQSVFLPAGVSGPCTVTLTAANINSPALPNTNNEPNQDFALVIYNSDATSTAGGSLPPTVVVQPVNQDGFLKGVVTFSSFSTGTAPLRYTWVKNGASVLAGAASSNLTVANLTAQSVGDYQVIVANKYGTATSAVAALTLVADPFTSLSGPYYGLFAESPARFESSGSVTLMLTSLGKFTAHILNAGGSYGFSGLFNVDGSWSGTVPRGPGLEPLAARIQLDLTNGTQRVAGQFSTGTWSAPLQADRAVYSAANPCPYRGNYTMLFVGASDGSAGPGGDGYATVSVAVNGLVSARGLLSDGTAVVSASAGISQYGQWPLYLPLYGGHGSLAGWIQFGASPSNSFAGPATWFRTGASSTLYPNGFTNALSIIGSTFSNGTSKRPVLAATNFLAILNGGGLAFPLSAAVTLGSNGRLTPGTGAIPGLALHVNPLTGVLAGVFKDPATGRTREIKGAVFQRQTNAAGFFLNNNATGSFLLTQP
jgi:hypothetical protein